MPDRFHWVVPGKIAGLSLPGRVAPLADDLAKIASVGLRALATLTEGPLDPAALQKAGITGRHFPIDDFSVPTLEQVEEFCAFVDARIAAGDAVGVHCWAGLGRTGLMIACWLVRDPATTTVEVLRTIRRIEPGYVQTAQQEAFISVWESRVRNASPRR